MSSTLVPLTGPFVFALCCSCCSVQQQYDAAIMLLLLQGCACRLLQPGQLMQYAFKNTSYKQPTFKRRSARMPPVLLACKHACSIRHPDTPQLVAVQAATSNLHVQTKVFGIRGKLPNRTMLSGPPVATVPTKWLAIWHAQPYVCRAGACRIG